MYAPSDGLHTTPLAPSLVDPVIIKQADSLDSRKLRQSFSKSVRKGSSTSATFATRAFFLRRTTRPVHFAGATRPCTLNLMLQVQSELDDIKSMFYTISPERV
ncbi:hypothetical protein PGT21_025276 [Puccinia graminis f. sp. tritici]|uniref:Uncharacterized protein n=1 Tax=Puccinia graminis f. sp. tritici TaxID=56615 RepID=A0A5B0S2X7_PUCGR|nr:hypothetical protein PGT21_025276 [Puccinia graminis f. sp. tritici]KAA1131725.1 hypothetical protein PGTUg99_017517 [Puccinia graminis f. sp. tritici]